MIRVAVTGGRDFIIADVIYGALERVFGDYQGIAKLIHGGQRGADSIAHDWAIENAIRVEIFPADWRAFGASAGPRRNRAMLTEGKPDLLVAFPGGKGTASCVAIAHELGIEVMEVAT